MSDQQSFLQPHGRHGTRLTDQYRPTPTATGLTRRTDPDTSHEAADAIAPKLSSIQTAVIAAYIQRGPMSARQAERLPELSEWGFSTIRKRVSELAQLGRLVEAGTETSSGKTRATVYRRVSE